MLCLKQKGMFNSVHRQWTRTIFQMHLLYVTSFLASLIEQEKGKRSRRQENHLHCHLFSPVCLPCPFLSSFRPRLFQSTLCTTVSSKCSIAQGGAATVSSKCSIAQEGATTISSKCSIAQGGATTISSKCSIAQGGAGMTCQRDCTSRITLQFVCKGGPNHFHRELGYSTISSKCSIAQGGAGITCPGASSIIQRFVH